MCGKFCIYLLAQLWQVAFCSIVPTARPTININPSNTSKLWYLDTSENVAIKVFSVRSKKNPSTNLNIAQDSLSSTPSIQPNYGNLTDDQGGDGLNTHKKRPSASPSRFPTFRPTRLPSSNYPSARTTLQPSTAIPTTKSPSRNPSYNPSTKLPSNRPTFSLNPSNLPTNSKSPSQRPTYRQSIAPSSSAPSQAPTKEPTKQPSRPPSTAPSFSPSRAPSIMPSKAFTSSPSSRFPSRASSLTATPSTSVPTVPFAKDIHYNINGTVFTGNLKVFNTYYGDFSAGSGVYTPPLLNYLAGHLHNSSWYNILSSYYAIRKGVKQYVNGSLTFSGNYSFQPTARNISTTITTIKNIIVPEIISNNKNILPNEDVILAIIFRGDFNVSLGSGSHWSTDWCGVHTGVYLNNSQHKRIFQPLVIFGDLSATPVARQNFCSIYTPYPNGRIGADSSANVYATAIARVITNPIPRANPKSSGWTFNISFCKSGSLPCDCADICGLYDGIPPQRVGSKYFIFQNLWQPRKR